jgi:hypothetical protein
MEKKRARDPKAPRPVGAVERGSGMSTRTIVGFGRRETPLDAVL